MLNDPDFAKVADVVCNIRALKNSYYSCSSSITKKRYKNLLDIEMSKRENIDALLMGAGQFYDSNKLQYYPELAKKLAPKKEKKSGLNAVKGQGGKFISINKNSPEAEAAGEEKVA